VGNVTVEQHEALVLQAPDTLFSKRDYEAAARLWLDRYVQHSAHIAPGRDGLFNLVRALPVTLRYENQLIAAEGDYVIGYGRFSGIGQHAAWIVPISSEWKTVNSPSIGTRSRTKQLRQNKK
jgi:hypothetical protein